ncbi:MAG: glycoside hydrolase family 6 protein [Gemmatimonadaceae bacterium]
MIDYVARSAFAHTVRRAAFALLGLTAACDAQGAVSPGDGSPDPAETGHVTAAPSFLAGARIWRNADSPARRQADAWRSSRPVDADMMDRIASQPIAQWIGGWTGDVRSHVRNIIARADGDGSVPVFVAYNIPHRDCGGYSASGAQSSAAGYRSWIRDVAAGIAGGRAVVVLEPDAVAQVSCLPAAGQEERFALLREAVELLKGAGAAVYIDAGNARWVGADVMAARLKRAAIDKADGFSLNVSNFISTAANVAYGEALSARLSGKHFVIDTSRNGTGGRSDGQWCNPSGQALGQSPTTRTGHRLVDAYLWIKYPGESDGPCNGGPAAGVWWPEYALGLAQRQAAILASRS